MDEEEEEEEEAEAKQGHERWSKRLGRGAQFQTSHRSLSITDSQGKNYTENRPGAGSAVHTSSALGSQTHSMFQRPLANQL